MLEFTPVLAFTPMLVHLNETDPKGPA